MSQIKRKKSNHVGKKFEEMTPAEQGEYKKDKAARFTWEEGDIKFIVNEPLTDEEKELNRQIMEYRAKKKGKIKNES